MALRDQSCETALLLCARARLCLFHGTAVKPEAALQMEDGAITAQLLLTSGSKPTNMLTAGLGPVSLKKRGVESAKQLRGLGFDALHLCDPVFAHQATLAFGADDVKCEFIVSPGDAVAIAGSEAMHIMHVTAFEMLEVCVGSPAEAAAVLKQLPSGSSLSGVPAVVLLDAGLRSHALVDNGYAISQIVKQCNASSKDLTKLGFSF